MRGGPDRLQDVRAIIVRGNYRSHIRKQQAEHLDLGRGDRRWRGEPDSYTPTATVVIHWADACRPTGLWMPRGQLTRRLEQGRSPKVQVVGGRRRVKRRTRTEASRWMRTAWLIGRRYPRICGHSRLARHRLRSLLLICLPRNLFTMEPFSAAGRRRQPCCKFFALTAPYSCARVALDSWEGMEPEPWPHPVI